MGYTTRRNGSSDPDGPLALIAAGGEGKRLGSLGPKALVLCGGRSLLARSLDAFAASDSFSAGRGHVVVAGHPGDLRAFEAACSDARADGLEVSVTGGGRSRSHSVAAALAVGLAAAPDAELVLVHDAARIFTSAELVDELVEGLAVDASADALIAASPVTDTIKRVDAEHFVTETPPREQLWAVQTPQAFRREALASALGHTGAVSDDTLATATDDASLVEAQGGRVKLLAWHSFNGKITTGEDLAAAELRFSRAAS